jgi:hypothetical protein
MKALAIAATGMNAQQLNLEVIANNVANINTTGFQAGPRRVRRSALPGRAQFRAFPTPPTRRSFPKARISGSACRPRPCETSTFRVAWSAPRTSLTWRWSGVGGSRSRPRMVKPSTPAPAPSTPTPTASWSPSTATCRRSRRSLSPMRPAKSSDFPYRADPCPHRR